MGTSLSDESAPRNYFTAILRSYTGRPVPFVRTTLDIDDSVLAMARQKAAAENISIGKALSNLALCGYQANTTQPVDDGEFLIFLGAEEPITAEMVDDAIYD